AWNEEPDTLALEMLNQQGDFGKAVTALGLNCGTYTTPFGNDEDGNPRQFPFIAGAPFVNQMVRADCAEAFVRGETIKLPNGLVVPICTGLILGVPGASLGLGLGMDLEIHSKLIEADVTASGDGTFDPLDPFNPSKNTTRIGYTKSANESGSSVPINTVTVDNYDDQDFADDAVLTFDDFTYCLNTFSLRLKGQIMFGGILTLFPDFDDFTIYRFTLPISGCGIPIGQHANTSGVKVPFFVENYGIEVEVETDPADPLRVDGKTLKVKPGEFGQFIVSVKNIGSVEGDFDAFGRELTNRMVNDQTDPFTFVINPNTDFDCRDTGSGNILRG
ncbi:MAG: hypothetical protein GWO24_20320, partial [Akkermansiaceae bacterium]|nr:hypothetical protein [Akkermansiaceae bacterium]NIS10917.1 hypothetical protein [Thermoplasmata archaeon]